MAFPDRQYINAATGKPANPLNGTPQGAAQIAGPSSPSSGIVNDQNKALSGVMNYNPEPVTYQKTRDPLTQKGLFDGVSGRHAAPGLIAALNAAGAMAGSDQNAVALEQKNNMFDTQNQQQNIANQQNANTNRLNASDSLTKRAQMMAPYGGGGFTGLGGFNKGGLIPGKVNPKVADDVVINAKRGEYIIPQEVVSALGKKFFDKIISQTRKGLGVPDVKGAKQADQPDQFGRMDAPGKTVLGVAGMAAGGDEERLVTWDELKKSPAAKGVGVIVDGFKTMGKAALTPATLFLDAVGGGINLASKALGGDAVFDFSPTLDMWSKKKDTGSVSPQQQPSAQQSSVSPPVPSATQTSASGRNPDGTVDNQAYRDMMARIEQGKAAQKSASGTAPASGRPIEQQMAERGLIRNPDGSNTWVRSPELEKAVEENYRINQMDPMDQQIYRHWKLGQDMAQRKMALDESRGAAEIKAHEAQARHYDATSSPEYLGRQNKIAEAKELQKREEEDSKRVTGILQDGHKITATKQAVADYRKYEKDLEGWNEKSGKYMDIISKNYPQHAPVFFESLKNMHLAKTPEEAQKYKAIADRQAQLMVGSYKDGGRNGVIEFFYNMPKFQTSGAVPYKNSAALGA